MKKTRIIFGILAVVMALALTMLVASPAMADVIPLDIDYKTPGRPAIAGNWVSVPGADALSDETVLSFGTAQPKVLVYSDKTRTWAPSEDDAKVSDFAWQRYEDESISVRCEFATLIPAYKKKSVQSSITYIRVADASQIRSAVSKDTYTGRAYVEAADMAKHVNAIAAVNGDFFKYHAKVGYVYRQGQLYRDALNGKRDLLLIDSNGDFHAIYAASSKDAKAYFDSLGNDFSIVNTYTLGPVLVENGEARVIKETVVAKSGEFQWCYPQQRVAILQTGPLEYAIVETYGKTDSSKGLTLQEFADYIAYLFPNCVMAYNLDGGGSTNVVLNGERIHTTPGHREICDIIYFASAYTESAE
ncbi:MAG: phosphodiester glycosidase family protein [Clostridia bacterium]|nr:phosphodiester glycosidase family protein [Clostridia bacterium]